MKLLTDRLAVVLSLFIVSLFSILPLHSSAQLGPFSNVAIYAASAVTVDTNRLEVQVTSSQTWSSKRFSVDGGVVALPEGTVESGLNLQLNSGITKDLEWGMGINFDGSSFNLGLKYKIADVTDKLMLATAAWTDIPTQNRTDWVKGDLNLGVVPALGVGMILQYAVTPKLNVYTDFYGQKYYRKVLPKHEINIYANVDIDYQFSDGLFAVLGVSYNKQRFAYPYQSNALTTLAYGVVIDKWERWNLFLAHSVGVMGIDRNMGNSVTGILMLVF